jgi:hypothetical protein
MRSGRCWPVNILPAVAGGRLPALYSVSCAPDVPQRRPARTRDSVVACHVERRGRVIRRVDLADALLTETRAFARVETTYVPSILPSMRSLRVVDGLDPGIGKSISEVDRTVDIRLIFAGADQEVDHGLLLPRSTVCRFLSRNRVSPDCSAQRSGIDHRFAHRFDTVPDVPQFPRASAESVGR